MKKIFIRAFLIVVCPSLPLFGQVKTASIRGIVQDQSEAVIPQVSVSAENVNTGISRQTFTDDRGEYSIADLDVGVYTIRAEKQGFKVTILEKIPLEIDQKARVDIVMTLGQVAEKVTVTEILPVVDTYDAEAREVITSKDVNELPLNGRNFIQLAQLIPNTTPGAPGNGNTPATGQGFAVSVLGQRDWNNNYTLDGIMMVEMRNPAPIFRPSLDAIQEFEVKTGNYSTEYGLRAGGQINIITKSGTNQFHGTAFAYLRNASLDARNEFDPAVKPNFSRTQFGGTIGGPILRKKLFFFANYEGQRQNKGISQQATVPPPAFLKGDFSSLSTPIIDPETGAPFPGNMIPTNRIDKIAQILIPFYPQPNLPGAVNFLSVSDQKFKIDQGYARVDQQVRQNDSLFYRYAYFKQVPLNFVPVIDHFQSFTVPQRGQNFTLQETHLFSPTVVNQFQYGFNRSYKTLNELERFPQVAKQLNFANVNSDPTLVGFPDVEVSGYAGIGELSEGQDLVINDITEIVDSLAVTKGSHAIKFGTNLYKIREDQNIPVCARGCINFDGSRTGNPVADLLLGLPSLDQSSTGNERARLRSWFYHFFVTDTWTATRDLSLTLGLRYELDEPVHDIRGGSRNFDPLTGQLFPAFGTPNVNFYRTPQKDFAPRLGFAWRPFGNDKTSIRGGVGIYYSIPEWNTVVDFNLNPPGFNLGTFVSTPGNPLTLENPFPGNPLAPGPATLFVVDPHKYREAFTNQWGLSVERNVGWNTVLEVGYFGQKSTGVMGDEGINQPVPGPGDPQTRRRFPNFGNIYEFAPIGFNNYEGLSVRAEKRFSGGFFFLTDYTWSHTIDSGPSPIFGDSYSGGFQNANNLGADKGNSAQDLRHVFHFSGGYTFPSSFQNGVLRAVLGNWQSLAILTLLSGPPFSVFVPGDPAGLAGDGTLRADRVASGHLSNPTIAEWFDTSAFVAPPPFTFGNSGRDILRLQGDGIWTFH